MALSFQNWWDELPATFIHAYQVVTFISVCFRFDSVLLCKAFLCDFVIEKKWKSERISNFVLNLENWPQKCTKWLNLRKLTKLWVVLEYLGAFTDLKLKEGRQKTMRGLSSMLLESKWKKKDLACSCVSDITPPLLLVHFTKMSCICFWSRAWGLSFWQGNF